MKLIEVSQVKLADNRQRQTFDEGALVEMAASLRTNGLLHPIVLRIVGDDYVLVAGERRLRALRDIYDLDGPGGRIKHDGEYVRFGFIPYVNLGELSPLAAEEAELEENIRRVDLTWQERAAATARLSALREKQAAERGEPPPSPAEIAAEITPSLAKTTGRAKVRVQQIVARHLHNPEVQAAKTLDEAFKVLIRQESAEKSRKLAEEIGATFTSDSHTALNGDSLSLLRTLPDAAFDCILTDPPYGMGADEFGDSGGRAEGAHAYKDDEAAWRSATELLATEGFRVAKAAAHIYCFLDQDKFGEAKSIFAAAGWEVFRTMLIWYKPAGSRAPWPDGGPQRKYECCLYARKGKRPALRMAGDVMEYATDKNRGHGAQKPVALYADLLRRSCRPGDSILDPFMGTGTIFAAAHPLKIAATGIELDPTFYGIALKRLEELRAQQELLP